MDLFQHRYYRLNKTLMKLVGQWPYQSFCAKLCFRAVLIYINASELLCRVMDIMKNLHDFGILLECAIPLFADLVCVTSLIVLMFNTQKTLQLLNRVRTDWQVWSQHPEINILHEYAEKGQKMNVFLTAAIYLAVFGDVTSLFTLKMIDALLRNNTEPGKFPTRVYYYRIDTQKYYFYVLTYYFVMVVILIMVGIANIVMAISYVQHACGLFAALGRKFEQVGNDDRAVRTTETKGRDMANLAWCIDRHNDAIEFANLIEELYTWSAGLTILFGMFLINILGLQVLTSTSDTEITIRSISFAFALIFLLTMGCHIAQTLTDHSLNIGFYIYNNQWYTLPIEAQKSVQLITMRCLIPCQMTAGKILILSVNTCGMTIKAAASYFTILRSTRGL